MNHLHNLGVLHRDLKLANILLHFPTMPTPVDSPLITQNSDWLSSSHLLSEQPFLIKIADLGFSKFLSDPANDLNTTYCGTPINMAPEVLNRGMYNYKADVWSLGTIIYEMITGFSPFKEASNKDQLKKRQKTSVIVPKDVQMSKECISFINMCLSYNSSKRPSWIELLNHRFFKNSNDSLINNKNMARASDLGSIPHK
jgi:serine/threonine-protein kinase ULK2